ncbi:MAG: SdpI family protein [Chitinophagaceae bacterium]|nr:SdpI family protein [Chitinophagaceae bacterium]
MRRVFTSPLLALVMLVLPFLYLGIQYAVLPETVPVHFNAAGEADKFGAKSSLWLHTCILSVVAIGTYLLIRNLHKIDPKKTAKTSADTLHSLAMVILLFLTVINITITYSAVSYPARFSITRIVFPAVGLLLSFVGYQMRTIQPNYFIGLRLPWTLEDDENWIATHQLAANLWVPGGLIIAIIAWILPFFSAFIITIVITAIIVIIPTIFSYRFFRKKQA